MGKDVTDLDYLADKISDRFDELASIVDDHASPRVMLEIGYMKAHVERDITDAVYEVLKADDAEATQKVAIDEDDIDDLFSQVERAYWDLEGLHTTRLSSRDAIDQLRDRLANSLERITGRSINAEKGTYDDEPLYTR